MQTEWLKSKITDRLNPKSIAEIYTESFCKWFRVRDITTLRDYLILDFVQNGKHVEVYCCDGHTRNTIDCTLKKYVLLSFREEGITYKRYKKEGVIESMRRAYPHT